VQEVASVEDHVSFALAPNVREVGLTEMLTVGAGALTVSVADALPLPPAPVHVRL
jgi:stage V sporulation protein SpoVS